MCLESKPQEKIMVIFADLDVKNYVLCHELLINMDLPCTGLDCFYILSLWKNLSVKLGSLMLQCFIP